MSDLEEEYHSLIAVTDLNGYSGADALSYLGRLIDISCDLQKTEGLERAINLTKDFPEEKLSSHELALFHYFVANAWSGLKALLRKNTEKVWDWEQEEIENEIFHLRKALQIATHGELPDERLCQILTNLGNLLSHIGRFLEAIEYWNRALEIMPSFGMAQGNRGYGLHYYAKQLYDQNHIVLFLKFALLDLKESLTKPLEPDTIEPLRECAEQIEARVPSEYLSREENLYDHSLGQSTQEIQYRKWCLQNKLFLNSLNDLGSFPLAASDILTLPGIVIKGKEPYYHGFFNQMKQEFVTARYLYYEGITSDEPHFSDRNVLLFNTLDYPCYSLAAEKVKTSYRMIYSLFDKVSFFLNHYLSLAIPERKVTFRTLWYINQEKRKGLRTEFQHRENWPLRGLFSLSKDLYENRSGFKETLEPDAKELHDIRNHLEHKYFKLHDDLWHRPSSKEDDVVKALSDKLAFSLYRGEFENKTLRLIKMARAAFIYLALAIQTEERHKVQKISAGKKIPHIHLNLDIWEDEWKR